MHFRVWLTGFFLLSLCFCSKPDTQALRELISKMEQEAEALNWQAFQTHISKHYKDDSGNTYFVILQLIKNHTTGLEALDAEVEIMGISVGEESSEVQLKLIVQGKKEGKIFYIVGREDLPEYPRIKFAKEGRQWRLIKVEGLKGTEDGLW